MATEGIDAGTAVDGSNPRAYGPVVDHSDFITMQPVIRGGKPVIRGLRITVDDVLSYLAAGMTPEQIVTDFPPLTRADIQAVLAYAADRERRISTAG